MDEQKVLKVQEERQELMQENQQLQEHHADPLLEQQDLRTEHMKKSKLRSVRETLQKIMPAGNLNAEQLQPIQRENQAHVRLHRRRGHSILDEDGGTELLKFDMAGSGYKQFRADHHGFNGSGKISIYGKEYDLNKDLASQLETAKKTRWYNRHLYGWIKGIRSPIEIEVHNDRLARYNQQVTQIFQAYKEKFEEQYGNKQRTEHSLIRVKKKGGIKKISMPGPQKMNGVFNGGEYSIQKLREYMRDEGAQYLRKTMESWDEQLRDIHDPEERAERKAELLHDIHILVKGHSRGAVAAGQGAMAIQAWVNENYPQFARFVKFDLIQYDPVPGIDARIAHHYMNEVDLKKGARVEKDHVKMDHLGADAETTVVYSLHTQYAAAFKPQVVKGAKRIILTPFNHSVGLNLIDTDHKTEDEQGEATSHRQGYTVEASNDVYMGSGINELDAGVYVLDELNHLNRMDSYEHTAAFLQEIYRDNKRKQPFRHKAIEEAVKIWFERANEQGTDAQA